jgi:hypothetical protein
MAGVQSRHGRRARRTRRRCLACASGAPRQVFCGHGVAHVECGPPVEAGSIGRFEILSELAILTSDILGSESSTTLVEKRRHRFVQQIPRLGESRTRRLDGQTLGEG